MTIVSTYIQYICLSYLLSYLRLSSGGQLEGRVVMWSRMNTQTFRGFSPELGRVLKIYKMPIDGLNNNFNRKYFNIQ